MAGLLAAAIGGAVAGAGQGAVDVGKEMYQDQNMRLQAQLATTREAYLADLNNKAAQTRTETQTASGEKVAGIGAAASMYGADTSAGAQRDVAATQAAAHVQGAQIGAQATLGAAGIGAKANIESANIHADMYRDSFRAMNTDADGNVFVVQDGQPKFLVDDDGNKIKSNKTLDPKTKEAADFLGKQILDLSRDMNDPNKAMAMSAETKAANQAKLIVLNTRLARTLGIEPSVFMGMSPPGAPAAPATFGAAAAPSGLTDPLGIRPRPVAGQ